MVVLQSVGTWSITVAKTVRPSKLQVWRGLDRITQIVHQMNCIFHELSRDDFGRDGEIEVVSSNHGSAPKELPREVLALAKMNVNNCTFADGDTDHDPVCREDRKVHETYSDRRDSADEIQVLYSGCREADNDTASRIANRRVVLLPHRPGCHGSDTMVTRTRLESDAAHGVANRSATFGENQERSSRLKNDDDSLPLIVEWEHARR